MGEPAAVPRLHVVTDDDILARRGWTEVAMSVLETGGSSVALHVRGPHTSGRVVYELASALVVTARRVGAWLVVNDRADVALAVGADAVHLGSRSLSAKATRASVTTTAHIGVSCRSADDVSLARTGGADYAFAGTVFTSQSHPEGRLLGASGFADIASGQTGFPVLAIGGVSVESTGELMAAGAHGVAVMRGVWDTSDPPAASASYLAELCGFSNENGRRGSHG